MSLKIMPIVSGFVTGCAAASLLYAFGLRGGYIVDAAGAQVIAQNAVEVEELARLEFVLLQKREQYRRLQRIEAPSSDDRIEMDDLRKDIDAISARVKVLKKQAA